LRLTHLKLAGFKSFVDPTTLHIHGQRVGVVGPNGCGKSNVMESVRWVMGESSAKELRGDSMDAVIFNGSANRKPISRASVELIFDNSLGQAAGNWSQYAEISVKRVIERDKGSSYFINNTPVRRRDVADLFLGTGLGGRAYAIIGQNTISRIVEAKPEELRVFLEEAAGISKYKERRRETELRLRDTRENLTRVEDIRSELSKQIARLEAQAVIAQQYHQLQQKLKETQASLWFLKKRDAASQWEKCKRNTEKLLNDLEAQMAMLRKTESALETLRQQHYASAEEVQKTQGLYYEANAQVANLEAQVKHNQEARERLANTLAQIDEAIKKADELSTSLQAQLQGLTLEAQAAESKSTQSDAELAQLKQDFPEIEARFTQMQKAYEASQRELTEAEQSIRLEKANHEHLSQILTELKTGLERLSLEKAALEIPDETSIAQKKTALTQVDSERQSFLATLSDLALKETQSNEEIKTLREQIIGDERSLARVNAQIASLSKIQASLGHEANLDQWLTAQRLNDASRVWEFIKIESGWEVALEAILGAKLNAIVNRTTRLTPESRPPSAIVLVDTSASLVSPDNKHTAWKPLLSLVTVKDAQLNSLISDWLSGVYVASSADEAESNRRELSPYESIVTKDGDIYGRHSLSVFATQSALHGVLERQKELEQLKEEQPIIETRLKKSLDALEQTELSMAQIKDAIRNERAKLDALTQQQHELNVGLQKLMQQRESALSREQFILAEIEKIKEKNQQTNQEQSAKLAQIEQLEASIPDRMNKKEQSSFSLKQAEETLNLARNQIQTAEKNQQENFFNSKIINNSINELNNKLQLNSDEKVSLSNRKVETETMLETAKMEGLATNLAAAIELKNEREQALAMARDAMAGLENELSNQERSRLQNEQTLHPLRDKLEQARLTEQEARIVFEQCQESLSKFGIDESKWLEDLKENTKVSSLEEKTLSIENEIESLGPVNLAAIQELQSETERKNYLDLQAQDLEEAVSTLEDAIRKIDKETRGRLQETYDEANRHFSELFRDLFGGGQAKLELLGDEILDTGIQVFAQPPGKRNSTIHLLSGGEKALTALALVFALFKLNPAPFCLLDEVDAPLDDSNTDRFCAMVKRMSERTQFLFVSHNKITMEMAQQLIGVTMQESGVSRVVEVDMESAMQMNQELAF
jgi:chromosome segregation protein